MERATTVTAAGKIMGLNIIGPDQLDGFKDQMGIILPFKRKSEIPPIPFSTGLLEQYCDTHLLILGITWAADGEALTLVKMRSHFGVDPGQREPCFYNQDWYLNEAFAKSFALAPNWFLMRKDLAGHSRGKEPSELPGNLRLPTALLACFAFFGYYFVSSGKKLWERDFIWCSDSDHNGDQIYVGRYNDLSGTNKSGFNIHRHLKIRENYGIADLV
jgi:hypothetical protein